MEAPTAVDPLALMRQLGRLYRLLHSTVQPVLESTLQLHPKQVQVLSAVAQGYTQPTQISTRIGVPAPSISRLIEQLIDAGLLERRLDPNDLRRFQLALTPQGLDILEDARHHVRRALGELMNHVPEDVLRQTDQLLTTLEAHLDPGRAS